MTADYQVICTKIAESDLLAILGYIMKDSPLSAKEVFNKSTVKAENLALFPERGRVVSELFSQGICFYRAIIIAL